MRSARIDQHWIAHTEINQLLRILQHQFSAATEQQHPFRLVLNKPLPLRRLEVIGVNEMQPPALAIDQRAL